MTDRLESPLFFQYMPTKRAHTNRKGADNSNLFRSPLQLLRAGKSELDHKKAWMRDFAAVIDLILKHGLTV